MTDRQQRLFFALWPDPATRRQLGQLVDQVAPGYGRAVAHANLHMTLAFIGASSPEQSNCYRRVASIVRGEPFSLTLDSFGFWRRPRVAWLGCSETPAALLALVNNLNSALAECGFKTERRRYEPHVTLLRKAKGVPVPKDFKPLCWTVDRFCLVESVTRPAGIEYQVRNEWLLDG